MTKESKMKKATKREKKFVKAVIKLNKAIAADEDHQKKKALSESAAIAAVRCGWTVEVALSADDKDRIDFLCQVPKDRDFLFRQYPLEPGYEAVGPDGDSDFQATRDWGKSGE